MTDEQIKAIKFKEILHLTMKDYYLTQYVAVNVPFDLHMQAEVPRDRVGFVKKGAKTRKRYMLNGKEMKYEKLIEKLKEIEV